MTCRAAVTAAARHGSHGLRGDGAATALGIERLTRARAVLEGCAGNGSLDSALAQYESTRNELSIPRFEVVDRIASHDWDDEQIAALQLQLSSAMANQVEALAALDAGAVSRRGFAQPDA